VHIHTYNIIIVFLQKGVFPPATSRLQAVEKKNPGCLAPNGRCILNSCPQNGILLQGFCVIVINYLSKWFDNGVLTNSNTMKNVYYIYI
jgi:hypothetical protein